MRANNNAPHITVVGNCGADLVVNPARIPTHGERIETDTFACLASGGAVNIATAARQLVQIPALWDELALTTMETYCVV